MDIWKDNCSDNDIGTIYTTNYFIKESNIDTDVLSTKINIINEFILSLSSASENFKLKFANIKIIKLFKTLHFFNFIKLILTFFKLVFFGTSCE